MRASAGPALGRLVRTWKVVVYPGATWSTSRPLFLLSNATPLSSSLSRTHTHTTELAIVRWWTPAVPCSVQIYNPHIVSLYKSLVCFRTKQSTFAKRRRDPGPSHIPAIVGFVRCHWLTRRARLPSCHGLACTAPPFSSFQLAPAHRFLLHLLLAPFSLLLLPVAFFLTGVCQSSLACCVCSYGAGASPAK